MTWTLACGAVTRSTVTKRATGTASGRRKATLLSCGYGNVPGCAGSWYRRHRCRNHKTLELPVGNIRDDMIDQAYTIENLLALRAADAAKVRQRWANEPAQEETDDG